VKKQQDPKYQRQSGKGGERAFVELGGEANLSRVLRQPCEPRSLSSHAL
jgi:hypothetical protein